jgi:protein TonB
VDQPVYPIGGEVIAPEPIYQPDPEFSEEARKKKVSGTVKLSFVVTSKGEVTDIKVANSVGSGLDEKAIEAVRSWKFKPATKDGQPVSALLAVEVDFKLLRDAP